MLLFVCKLVSWIKTSKDTTGKFSYIPYPIFKPSLHLLDSIIKNKVARMAETFKM